MKKMTSRERLLAAARQAPVDMIPFAPRVGHAAHSHCGSESAPNMLRLKKIYDYDPFITVQGQDLPFLDPYQTFHYAPGVNVDINIKDQGTRRTIDRTIHTPDGDLHEILWMPNPGKSEYGHAPNPRHVEYMVKNPDDVHKVRHLVPRVSTAWADEYHGWEATAGDEAVIRAAIYAPLDYQASYVMSIEDIMMDYLCDRAGIDGLVDMFRQYVTAQTKALLEAGVRYFSASWYAHSLSVGWSPQIFREWSLPMIKEQVDLIHSYDGIVHYYDDGKLMGIFPMLLEAGVDVVETCTPARGGDVDLAAARRLCGDKMTLMGHVDLIYVIQKGTVEDVRHAVESACRIGGKDGCFILGTSDSIRENTPMENIDAYFKYGRECGML